MVIEDVDAKGAYIRLGNQSEADVPIGGGMIKAIGADKVVVFEFHPRQAIMRGRTITVWSNNAGHEHSPPTHIALKFQSWPVAADVEFLVPDADGEVEVTGKTYALHDRKTQKYSSIGKVLTVCNVIAMAERAESDSLDTCSAELLKEVGSSALGGGTGERMTGWLAVLIDPLSGLSRAARP